MAKKKRQTKKKRPAAAARAAAPKRRAKRKATPAPFVPAWPPRFKVPRDVYVRGVNEPDAGHVRVYGEAMDHAPPPDWWDQKI